VKKPWTNFVTIENEKYISPAALSFLDGLLQYDHQSRFTPTEAMTHNYFGKPDLQQIHTEIF
jgi:casein kinase II subunit alpha